ncbi:hypothetical protein WICPIJ_002835 [Wickerhamomyces pijperi]|uniref:Uncharacterized protein n=1 Tax=Wickerhamomyces pijperi TaxID=599730 RepID=A0A9P8Q924_WICPI|nr:hypothetical protein WICPIJ_002835 [Wickerhamomyces pijperi]
MSTSTVPEHISNSNNRAELPQEPPIYTLVNTNQASDQRNDTRADQVANSRQQQQPSPPQLRSSSGSELPTYTQTLLNSQRPPKYAALTHRDQMRHTLIQPADSDVYTRNESAIQRMLGAVIQEVGFEDSVTNLNFENLLNVDRDVLNQLDSSVPDDHY